MKSVTLLSLAALPNMVLAHDFMARRKGAEFNIAARHEHASVQSEGLEKRASCGKDSGSCPKGQCCSAAGYCGTTSPYCSSPQCQMAYSNSNCDGSKKPKGDTTANIPRSTNGKAPYILDVLKQNNIKATFFITGTNLGKGQIDDETAGWPKILRRMYSEGHQLASHTWSHQDLTASSDEVRQQQIIYNEMAFRNIFGFFPKYLRPPYGTCNRVSGCLDYATKLGYHVINWNLDTKDFENNTPDKIQTSKNTFSQGVSTNAKANAYIELSHDVQEQTAYNLTAFMIKTIKDRGYKAVPVGECLGDARENWYVTDPNFTTSASVDSATPSTSPTTAATATTRDGKCGATNGGTKCTGSKWGDCCSYNNFCGSTSGYCDGGCQSEFGKCNKWTTGSALIVSANGLCGDKYHQTCKGSTYGDCCSKSGNCGKTSAYCGNGCQNGFGTCTSSK
ncbi:probable chitin binding protein [Fusarium fujikuroi IMI 58289]|uniref:Probable chitin binding protein n=1 Tax=Gibberella fujikuroi (strain CBS 195.34 / IMI 58289 / NRRL A-6831) TaxID=1279085 RepID=S0EMK4_GIBF5|nr:probable chitin binding protein [Fusarium fujikuroi IMI 58289]KLO79557.1 putative chitin binding protein [Fusarium fujikuroi]KLO87833.1 putative chitin binding protein [Fusarium fujikuroi]CCT73603.1 probable chitin binding protein [Fusarium fujikuroi IMI 58289]